MSKPDFVSGGMIAAVDNAVEGMLAQLDRIAEEHGLSNAQMQALISYARGDFVTSEYSHWAHNNAWYRNVGDTV